MTCHDNEAAFLALATRDDWPDHPNRGRVEATIALFDRRPDLRTIGAAGVMVAASLCG